MRVPVLVLALLAMPIAAGVAQSRAKGKDQRVRAADVVSDCKDQQAATLARANADGHDPYGLDKKCGDPVPVLPPPPAPVPPPPPAPVPPPSSYPTGIHEARGVVYEDVDGSGSRDMFSGEMGLAGWTVQLYWDGQLVGTATSDADGMYLFPGLGNSDKAWWICVIPQAGYARTQPVSGDACSGNGMVHFLSSPFMTRLQTDFGEMIQ
jgi:hypothetical protein